jgi:hypothetical protein
VLAEFDVLDGGQYWRWYLLIFKITYIYKRMGFMLVQPQMVN